MVGQRLSLAMRLFLEMEGRRGQGGEWTWFALAPPYGSVIVLVWCWEKEGAHKGAMVGRLWFCSRASEALSKGSEPR